MHHTPVFKSSRNTRSCRIQPQSRTHCSTIHRTYSINKTNTNSMGTDEPFRSVEAHEFCSFTECLDWCRSSTRQDGEPLNIFFCHTLCPYAERVWLALLEEPCFRENFVLVHVDLSNKPRWYLEHIHPRGLVPSVCVDHGEGPCDVHIESLDICKWILGTGNDTVGGDVNALISASLDAMAGNGRYWGIGTSISKRQRDDFERACATVFDPSRKLSQLESICLFPFMYRAWVAMKSAYGIDILPMCSGRVGAWMKSMMSRQSTRITCAQEDVLAKAFQTHKSLDFFDYVSYSKFDLHPHLTRNEQRVFM